MNGSGFLYFMLFFGPIAAMWLFGMGWYYWSRQRHGVDIETQMKNAARYLGFDDFNRSGPRSGSLIIEHADYEFAPLAWWTPDHLCEANSPTPPGPEDVDSFIPDAFSAWCMDHYLNRETGKAMLLTSHLSAWLRDELEEAHPGLRYYEAWTFPLHHGHRYVAPPELIIDPDEGYHAADNENHMIDSVRWDGVKEIVAYKTNHFKHGEVCVAFRVDKDGEWHEISDASSGFKSVAEGMEKQFPSIPGNWYEREKQPHAEHADTVLYSRASG